MERTFFKMALLPLVLFSLPAFSATEINLSHYTPAVFKQDFTVKEVKRSVDFNQTLHIRQQQIFQGVKVWGGEGIVHIPQMGAVTMNGKMYKNIDTDLQNTPPYALQAEQSARLIQLAIADYQTKKHALVKTSNAHSKLIVYIDKNKKANWAYYIKFAVAPATKKDMPARPVYIIDAVTKEIYKSWNDLRTLDDVVAGGYGGNKKVGKITYNGQAHNFPVLHIQRDAQNQTCYLQNSDVVMHDMRYKEAIFEFPCADMDKTQKMYWDGERDAINGAYSPANDAFYEGSVIKALYKKWYGLDVLTEKDGKPMLLNMYVHENMENAYWDPDTSRMVFGDGDGMFMLYPLTSLDVAAHEVSHGFTSQHSNLTYEGQSGGMNESFSDMAAQAAAYYSTGKNNWMIGSDITLWLLGDALRYMDIPSKDCTMGKTKGKDCSIDDADEYNDKLDVHFSSGVYNRLFYLLATSKGWNTHKAFDVMVKANSDYWTPNTNFNDGACGIIKSSQDYKYDVAAVKKAIMKVGIDISDC